jgi:hypothetical protein
MQEFVVHPKLNFDFLFNKGSDILFLLKHLSFYSYVSSSAFDSVPSWSPAAVAGLCQELRL